MGTLRTYNKDLGHWEVVSTTDASQVKSRSEQLVDYVGGEESKEPDVQTILEKVVQDVNTAKGNISWLALHGGGGSGSGGGPTTATGTIKVNGNIESGNTLVRKETERLYFNVEQEVTQTWNYSVTFNNRVIKTGTTANGQVLIADAANPLFGTVNQGTLYITCSCGLSNIYWSGTIIKSQLTIETNTVACKKEDITTTDIIYTLAGSMLGEYTLKVNNKTYQVSITQVNTPVVMSFKVSDFYSTTDIGSNTTVVSFTNNADPTVTTGITHQVVITSDTIVISSDTLSLIAPTDIPKNSNIPCAFTAYLSGESFMQYKIFLNDVDIFGEWQTDGTFGSMVQKFIPTSDGDLVIGNTYRLVITIQSATGKEASATYGVTITESRNIELTKPKTESLLSDFRAYGNSEGVVWNSSIDSYIYLGNNPSVVTQNVEEFSKNMLSGLIVPRTVPTYFRLSNKAYARLSPWTINNRELSFQDILNVKKDFTISLTFKADYHSEDNRTIFQLGRLYSPDDKDNANELQEGILIRVHGITIKSNSSICEVELQDNEIYNVDIVYTAATGTAKVYIDGVITKANTALGVISFAGCQPYLGCSFNAGECLDFADCQFYRIMFYTTALTDYDILINHLQNKSYTNFVDGRPDDSLITEGFRRNFIDIDPNTSQILDSWFWDTQDNNYSLANFIVNNVTEGKATSTLNPNIDEFTLPIPLLFIDLSSASEWSWSNFTGLAKVGAAHNIPFIYYDQSDPQKQKIRGACSIDTQGTSTLANELKNLLFSLVPSSDANPNCFVPKANWLPETSYTLKADIVDSSHSLNASIGKFVNEALANSEEGSQWFPIRQETLTEFHNSEYYTNCDSDRKPTLKSAVEGFPVFLIIRFFDSDPYKVDVRSLGIYQFILGRDSIHNLGLKVLNKVTDVATGGSIVPDKVPFYSPNCRFEENNTEAYWVEAVDTQNVLEGTDLSSKDFNPTGCNGLVASCWQSTDTMLNSQFEVKYGSSEPSHVPHFKEMIESISKSPACLFNYYDSSIGGNNQKLLPKGSSFPALNKVDNEYTPAGTVQVARNDDEITIGDNLDITNAYKYFTIGMLFGLSDNFCKNQPFVLFDALNNDKFRLTLYDMDTGCGGGNNGDINKPASLYSKGLVNDGNYIRETFQKNDSSIISGVDNKLWLSLEDSSVAKVTVGLLENENPYSYYWGNFRNSIAEKYKGEYKDFADYFVNKYFVPQTSGCGELLFNLTYQMKYLNTAQSSYLNGRRITQVTQWLREHIDFLDSVASWKSALSQAVSAFDCNEGVPLRLYSKDIYTVLPVKYNKTLVIKTTDQGGNYTYPALCEKNVTTRIRYGGGTQSTDAIQKTISWSNSLLELGDDTLTLGASGFQKIDANTLYGLNKLDLSGCNTLSSVKGASPINFFNTFYDRKKSPELRVINLRNATNPGGVSNMILDLENFLKLTDLDIENSCVASVTLPYTPLVTLNIVGSAISNLELEHQNLLSSIDVTGCSKLSRINIGGCRTLKDIKGINNLNNLTNVLIAQNAVETLFIRNCSNLASIQIVEPTLRELEIDGCHNLTSLNLAQCTSLQSIKVTNCSRLEQIVMSPKNLNDWEERVVVFDVHNTKVKKIVYGTESTDSYLDLSSFINLKVFDIKENSNIVNIRFANREDTPIPLQNRFTGCTNLTRIYGHVEVWNDTSAGNGSFTGCTKFTIHGDTFRGKSVKVRGKYQMPFELYGHTTPPEQEVLKKEMFGKGELDTNMELAGFYASYMFSRTACTQFDVYYVFSNPGTVVNFTNTFSKLINKIFEWTTEVDNSPNRYLFTYCGNVKTLSFPFRDSCGYYRIFSPVRDSNGNIVENNGLFSPLVNVEALALGLHVNCIIDNFVFRRKEGTGAFRNLTTLKFFNPCLIVKDVNTMGYLNVSALASVLQYLREGDNYRYCGSLSNFFKDTPAISTLIGIMNATYFINFDASYNTSIAEETFLIPTTIQTMTGCFTPHYATGRIRFEQYFGTTGLRQLNSSFIVHKSLAEATGTLIADPTLSLSKDTFKNFSSITHIGYIKSGDYAATSLASSFSGYITKTVELDGDGKFPNMFANNPNLTRVSGLFMNARCSRDVVVELPGNLFKNLRNLTDVSACFYNFNSDYTLTSDGFINCTKLDDVSYLFGQDKNRQTFRLIGSIPTRLFYHGGRTITKTVTGTDDYTPETSTYGTPQNFSFDYEEVNATISNMKYCFQRCNADPYNNESPTTERNKDYVKWKYLYKDGVWESSPVWSSDENKLDTIIWSFDGLNYPSDFDSSVVETLDENVDYSQLPTIPSPSDEGVVYGDLRYCCAPDLLRYCKPDASIEGLFAYSGVNTHLVKWADAKPFSAFGIKGRICPYLLKPVPRVTNLDNMFRDCKLIGAYMENGSTTTYKIPKTFFNYARAVNSLKYAFSGMSFNSTVNLRVFSVLDNINIDHIFFTPYFEDNAYIYGVFTGNTILNADHAFSMVATYGDPVVEQNYFISGQKVTFSGNFTASKVVRSTIGGHYTDGHVFSGYSSSTVKFENKTLDQAAGKYNYATV